MTDNAQDTNQVPQADLPPVTHEATRPAVLSDAEFDSYCDALARGYSETEIMAAFGISRREYWRIQCAANRRRNREAWAQTKQFRESNRRFEKWNDLYERAMQNGDREFTARNGNTIRITKPYRSIRAMRRWSAYHWYDQNRTP